jgi:hypothetical protein
MFGTFLQEMYDFLITPFSAAIYRYFSTLFIFGNTDSKRNQDRAEIPINVSDLIVD